MFLLKRLNKITLSAKKDKRIESVDLVETYAIGTQKDWIGKKEETKWNNIIKQSEKWFTLMMLQKKKKNQNWLKIHYHPCTISITVGSESGKTNSSFNVISH